MMIPSHTRPAGILLTALLKACAAGDAPLIRAAWDTPAGPAPIPALDAERVDFWLDYMDSPFWAEVASNVVNVWAASAPHRENMARKDLKEIGVGAAVTTEEAGPRVYVTQDFLR